MALHGEAELSLLVLVDDGQVLVAAMGSGGALARYFIS